MDKRKLAKYAIGAGIIGVCAYSGYNMGSEIGYEQGAYFAESIYNIVYDSNLQNLCRGVGGIVGATVLATFGAGGTYLASKVGKSLHKE